MLRWRHDKPVDEIDTLDALKGDAGRSRLTALPPCRTARLDWPDSITKGQPMTIPVFDANAAGAGHNEFGDLPEWNLADLYAAPGRARVTRDLAWLQAACAELRRRLRGQARHPRRRRPARLRPPLRADRGVSPGGSCPTRACATTRTPSTPSARQVHGRRAGPGDRLHHAARVLQPGIQPAGRRPSGAPACGATPISPATSRSSTGCARCGRTSCRTSWRSSCTTQSVVGASAWNKLFDETMAGLMFTVDGRDADLNLEGHAEPPDRPATAPGARPAADALAGVVRREHQALRPRPQHARQGKGDRRPLAQDADAADRAAPVQPCRARGGRGPAQRRRRGLPASSPTATTALKAKWMGLDKLQVWDRNAPLPTETPRTVDWARGAAAP